MGARKSRHSKPHREAQQRYGARRIRTRAPLPIVVVICDDTKVAVRYFDALKLLYRGRVTIRTQCAASHGATPPQLLAQARSVLNEYAGGDGTTHLWLLVDTENQQARRSQALGVRGAARQNLYVAISEPCFELWSLLHLEDTGAGYQHCNQVRTALLTAWQREFHVPTTKRHMPFDKIVGRHRDAAERARRHREAGAPSWTEIDLVIDDIVQLASQNDPSALRGS